jgi:hypothetical protein
MAYRTGLVPREDRHMAAPQPIFQTDELTCRLSHFLAPEKTDMLCYLCDLK